MSQSQTALLAFAMIWTADVLYPLQRQKHPPDSRRGAANRFGVEMTADALEPERAEIFGLSTH